MRRRPVASTPIGAAMLAALVAIAVRASPAFASSAPVVTTGAVTSIEPTTVVVTGTVDPSGSATTYFFEYGPSSDAGYPSRTAAKSAGSGSTAMSVSAALIGLSPATSYRYRLVATNAAATTDGADGIVDTTAAPGATTAAASGLTASAATLNGIVNPEALPTTWYFQYGPTTAYASKTPAKAIAPGPNDSNVHATLNGLTPRTTYHYRLVAQSRAGTTYGHDLSFSTGLSVTVNAGETSVTYGGFAQLAGKVTSTRSGVPVTVLAQRFDQASFAPIASVTTGSGGLWSFSAEPSARTTYEATAAGGASSPVTVGVRPAVFLVRLADGQLATHVVAATSFASHVLQLQRLEHGLWVTWKSVRLSSTANARFATSLPRGHTVVRMAIGPFIPGINQAGPGYLAGFSRSIVYRR